MKCRVCGREIGDDEQFCKYCGSEQKRKRKRLTWGERKRKNEAETKEFIAKASLQEQEVKDAVEEPASAVRAVFIADADKYFRKVVALTALFAALTVAAFAGLILLRFVELNDTLVVALAFVLLIVAAYGAASFAERLYATRALAAMRKSGRGIKKVRYAHPPLMLKDGEIYRLVPAEKCPICGTERHLEEFEGKQILVCNADRGHIAVLDVDGLFDSQGKEGEKTEETAVKSGGKDEGEGESAERIEEEKSGGASCEKERAEKKGE